MTSGHEVERLTLNRVYDPTGQRHRLLVDRLWPRGVSKRDAALDEWLKDVAPTTELREWYGHQPGRFDEFRRRYAQELGRSPAQRSVGHILELARTRNVALLTATRDVEHSAARVLLEHLHSATRRRLAAVDDLVDDWGCDSFPASDPPGCLPPTLAVGGSS